MPDENANLALIREVYRRWDASKGADSDFLLSLMDAGVRFRSIADGARGMEFTRDCACRDDVVRYFAELAGDWEMLHYTVEELIAAGDRVVMLGHCGWKHRRSGVAIDTPKADFFRLRDGKIVEFYEFYDTAMALAAARGESV